MLDLKTIARMFPVYTVLLVHNSSMWNRMPAGAINESWQNKTIKAIIPLDAYKAEIVVED